MDNVLGVFGDSFAVAHPAPCIIGKPWPTIFAKKFNMKLDCYATPGTSIWWSYQLFLKHHEKYKFIVFCYSQHNRWHHLSEECVGLYHMTVPKPYIPEPVTKERLKIVEILNSAYRYVASEELDTFIFQEVFNKVNKICKEKNIILVNLLPFETGTNIIDYSEAAGPLISNLERLTWIERSQLTNEQDEAFCEMINKGDVRPCHMSAKHNELLVTLITEQLRETEYKMIDICQDPRVSGDPLDNEGLYEVI